MEDFNDLNVKRIANRFACFGVTPTLVEGSLAVLGPAFKFVPSVATFPNSAIVTVDDDLFYGSAVVERLVESYEANKTVIHCHRTRVIPVDDDGTFIPIMLRRWPMFAAGNCMPNASPLLFAEGVGAVLDPPGVLDNRVFFSDLCKALCPVHDDLWLWAMALLRGTLTLVVKGWTALIDIGGMTKSRSFADENIGKGMYITQTVSVFNHFNLSRLFAGVEGTIAEQHRSRRRR